MSEVATTGITAGGARQPPALTGVNVTNHPTDAWVAQQLRAATPFGEAPKHLICDNDTKYGPEFNRVAEASGIDVIHTPYQAPLANSICERYIGSLWRECLDHVLVVGHRQLVRVVTAYIEYSNPSRPHKGIGQQTPESRGLSVPTASTGNIISLPVSSVAMSDRGGSGKLMVFPVLNGLHHTYAWAT